MKLMVTVYKESGKFYVCKTVENEKDIPIYEKETFKEFIRKNIPDIGQGYVLINDLTFEEGFHDCLFTNSELFDKEPDNVTISKEEYDNLLMKSKFLEELENRGVDNWPGYGEAYGAAYYDE